MTAAVCVGWLALALVMGAMIGAVLTIAHSPTVRRVLDHQDFEED